MHRAACASEARTCPPGPEQPVDGCLVTFVVIGRNEEDVIAQSLESVSQAARALPSWECIYVDSASQDDTVNRASAFPITVIRLSQDQMLSAALGRYVGTRHASGTYLMYIDGDCLLQPGFVEKAVAALDADASLAGAVGTRGKTLIRGNAETPQDAQPVIKWDEPRDCDVVATGGVGFFRRAYVEQVGGYNGVMRSNEERELCLRLQHAGYRIRCIPHPMMMHNSHVRQHDLSYAELVRRFRSGLLEGPGQMLRRALVDRQFSRKYMEAGTDRVLAFVVWTFVGILSAAASLVLRTAACIELWAAATLLLVFLFFLKTRSLKRTAYYTVASVIQGIGLVRGFARGCGHGKPCRPVYEVLKTGTVNGSTT